MKRILLFTMMCLFGLFSSLNAQETTFFYDFEDGTLNGWNAYKLPEATSPGWAVDQGSYYGGQGDSYGAYSPSYNYTARNYLVTAQKYLITETSTVSWWVKHTYPGYESYDPYQMIVSEDGESFTPLYDGTVTQGENNKSVSLSSYAGKELYIGFYHYGNANGDAIVLDNIALTSDEDGSETPDDGNDDPAVAQYRIKLVSNTNSSIGVGQYLTIESYVAHADGPAGGVALKGYEESNAQIFTIEDAGNNLVYLRSADGYYIYCQSWNVDAYSTAYDMTALGMTDLGDGTFYLMNGTKHFKVESVNNSGYDGIYPFCDATTASTTWTLEEVINDDLEPAVPTNLVATAESHNSISLTWDEAENAVKYNVYYDGNLIGEGVTETSYTVNGLSAETEYCFTVAGVRGAKESAKSEEVCATTLEFDGCIIEFVLKDSYGDGWNGNTLVVTGSDGVSEVLGLSGGSSTTYTLQFAKGAHVTLLYTNNGLSYTYTTENSLIVRYEGGVEIINKAEGSLTSGDTFEFDVDCTPVAPATPTVVAQTVSDTEIALSLVAAGAETFTIYQGTEVLVENFEDETYTVSGLTPETTYCFTAKAFNEVGESELSEEVCATTYKEGTVVVQVGESDGYTAWSTPVADYYYYSMSQTIYTAEEIGVDAGSIVAIAYNKASGAHNTRNISVYMKSTDQTTLTSWETLTSDMCVYNGTLTFGEPGWITINLQEAFSYEGGNLLVCVVDNTAVNATSYDSFYTYLPGAQRAIYGQSSSAPIDPANTTINYLPIYDNNYGVRSPQTKFVIETEEGETPTPSIAAPTNLAATEITQNSITLTWDAVDGAMDYYVYKDGTMWANTGGATTHTENGLTAGTEYCFAVQAAGMTGDSELSEELCVETESVEMAENEILVGTATKNNYAPFCPALGSSHVEMIYKAEEIGKACTISEIAFSYYSGSVAEADIDIYLAETTKSAFSGESDVTPSTDLTLVYSGTAVTLCDEEWDAFVLDTPFNYSGENNLLVVATMNSNAGSTAYVKWNSYSDPSSVIIKDMLVLNDKPVMKLTLGQGGSDEPAEITHRLVGIYQNEYNNVAYTYESETSNVVTEVVSGYYKTVLEYNEDGQIVKTTYAWADPSTGEMDLSNYTLVTYTYEDGVLVSYKEDLINSWYPTSTEYTFTYEDNFVLKSWTNAKEEYYFEDGRLVEKSRYYYDQYAETPDFVRESMTKYEYDENGNCVSETQYSTYGDEPTPQNGVDYYYDMTIAAENVATFAYPHEFLPSHANLVTKALTYYYQENWETGEVSKSGFEVQQYNYDPEVVTAPFAPLELKANVLSDTEISLTWVSVEETESFNVYCNGELAGNATETSYTVEGLTAATEYTFTVKGVNAGVESEASNEAVATTMDLVNVVPNEIAFGDVKMGEFWAENPTGVEVTINPLGKTIASVTVDNDFFRLPATINLTEEPITFKVDYKKTAEVGEYTGNLVVTLSAGETVTIPLSATAYTPVSPDVFELAQEIEFVDGAYTDAPDFTTLHDDYNLPNEAEGNNPDAVYVFTVDTESVVNVEVTGENAVYATYKAFDEEEGPTAENAFFGEETVLSTAFSYDFESADLSDFTIVDNDEFKDYTWTVEEGSLVSYSFVPTPDYSEPYYVANDADERIITNKAYAITANSVLTLDINVNGSGGNFNWGEAVFIEVTQDGETFTQVGIAYDDETTYSYEFMSKRINIGAKFAELGLEYGEYQIVLHHDQSGYGHISVDNFALTERVDVYTAGTYYLVAAAAEAFEVNVEVAEQEMPVAPKAYRLVSKENHEATTYVYDATDVNRVVRIESDGTVEELEYNADGTLAGYKTVVTYEDPEAGVVEEEVGGVSYVYEDGRLVSYTELAQSWQGLVEIATEITYNAEGQVESVLCADYETVTTFVYNAEGLVSEMATGYLWDGEAIVDAKEVFTYENGKLVKQEYMAYDYFLDDGSFYVAERTDYTYDANGNCVKAETFTIEIDEETEEEVESLYKTVEYYYNTTVLAEDVYTFEYPHFAFTYPVKPAAVNVLTKDMSYMTGYDWDGNYGNHSHVLTVYGYDPEILSAPYAPFNLTAEATGESTVALTWEAYADAETFAVYNGTEKVADGIEGFEYTVEGLTAATEYCFTVKAVNAAGESEASNEACATTEEAAATVPAAPTNVRATAAGPYSIIVEWDKVENATKYALYYGDEKLDETEGLGGKVEVDTPEAEYCFTVTAINEVGESEHSEEACATTLPDGIEENEASFNIYPNPVENMLFIETEAFVEEVSIYTITGTLIYKEVDFNSNTIDVSEFNGGVYIMKVRTEAGEIVKRFVKQ